jgi:hypothetical protein
VSADVRNETDRVREVQDKHASGDDRQMGFFAVASLQTDLRRRTDEVDRRDEWCHQAATCSANLSK